MARAYHKHDTPITDAVRHVSVLGVRGMCCGHLVLPVFHWHCAHNRCGPPHAHRSQESPLDTLHSAPGAPRHVSTAPLDVDTSRGRSVTLPCHSDRSPDSPSGLTMSLSPSMQLERALEAGVSTHPSPGLSTRRATPWSASRRPLPNLGAPDSPDSPGMHELALISGLFRENFRPHPTNASAGAGSIPQRRDSVDGTPPWDDMLRMSAVSTPELDGVWSPGADVMM